MCRFCGKTFDTPLPDGMLDRLRTKLEGGERLARWEWDLVRQEWERLREDEEREGSRAVFDLMTPRRR